VPRHAISIYAAPAAPKPQIGILHRESTTLALKILESFFITEEKRAIRTQIFRDLLRLWLWAMFV
jgi:hypothetical protein